MVLVPKVSPESPCPRLGFKRAKAVFNAHNLGHNETEKPVGTFVVEVGYNHPYEGFVALITCSGPSARIAFCEAMTRFVYEYNKLHPETDLEEVPASELLALTAIADA